MDFSQPLDFLPIWALYLLTVLLAMLFVGLGTGWVASGKNDPHRNRQKRADLGSIVGATFGLMAFLLVFLIGIAANRFDNRRQLATAEAMSQQGPPFCARIS
jgi:hypothetical protein